MRTREKARIWRRFMAGESVQTLGDWYFTNIGWVAFPNEIVENILREGMAGKFDPLPVKQARAYARAAGVKVGRMVMV
jgi:hypothetical protein